MRTQFEVVIEILASKLAVMENPASKLAGEKAVASCTHSSFAGYAVRDAHSPKPRPLVLIRKQ
ncbi:MAG: hypothetical protein WAO35_13020 [Terriglobia bacterium]